MAKLLQKIAKNTRKARQQQLATKRRATFLQRQKEKSYFISTFKSNCLKINCVLLIGFMHKTMMLSVNLWTMAH